eukprot:s1654_g12.t2
MAPNPFNRNSHQCSQPDMPGSSGLMGQSMQSSFPAMPNDEVIEDQCTRCGMFYEDEFSSSPESDVGDDDSEAGQLHAHYNNDPSLLGNVLDGEYMSAKQRWRRFSGRPPRRYRRGHFNKYHQKNNYQKLQRYGKTCASFLPPNAFAAHRASSVKRAGSVINDLESIRRIASGKHRAENCESEVQSETASFARPMQPPPIEPAPSAQDLAVASTQASAMMWTCVRTGLMSSPGSDAGSLVGRSSSDVSNVLAGISFGISCKTHGSGGDVAEGPTGSKSRRKTGGQDDRQQRMREATTLQLSELLAGMGRVNQPFSMPRAAMPQRSLTNAGSPVPEPKATDASSEAPDADEASAGYPPWWETV